MFRRLALLAALGAGPVWAGPDDDFIVAYQLIQRTDAYREAGQVGEARAGYERARELLQALKRSYPQWNDRVVAYRLRYVAEKLDALPTNAPTSTVIVGEPAAPPTRTTDVLGHYSALNSQIAELRTEKQRLEARLREALTAQPAPVDPKELQAAVDRIAALQSTNQMLLAQLEVQQTERKTLVEKVLLDEAQQALNAANDRITQQQHKALELERLRNLAQDELKRLREVELKELTVANTTLKTQVEQLQVSTDRGGQIANLAERVSKLQEQLDQSARENEALAADRDRLDQELRDFRARQTEEGIVRMKQLETDLALARAQVERHAAAAVQLEARLAVAAGSVARLEQENKDLVSRIEALTEQAAEVKVLQAQLTAEQEEREELENQLRSAEERLAAAQGGTLGAATTAAGDASLPDPGLVSQVHMLEAETVRLRELLRDGRARQTELAALLAESEKAKSRLELEKRELMKSLTAAQATPSQKQLARAERTIESLEARVRELEGERKKLAEKLAQATAKSQTGLQLARRARLGNPREDILRFRLERSY